MLEPASRATRPDPAGSPDSGIVFDIKRYSIHDGPGIRTTVFFKGCPLRCRWCHNPESMAPRPVLTFDPDKCLDECRRCVTACPTGALSRTAGGVSIDPATCVVCGTCAASCPGEALDRIGRRMSVADVLAVVERDRAFYDESGGGVTFSGGEPLAQPEFLLALLRRCRSVGIHTAVDTSGYVATDTLLRIAAATDLFLFDIKTIDDERHIRTTGVPNRIIRENLRHLADSGASIVVRIPLVPGVNDDEAELRRLAGELASIPGIRQVALLPFHPSARRKYLRLGMDNPMADVPPPSPERVTAAIDILTESGLTVQTGG